LRRERGKEKDEQELTKPWLEERGKGEKVDVAS